MTLTLNMKLTPFKDVKLLRLEECRWKKAKHESLSWQFKTHILLIFYRFRAVWTKNLCNEKSLSFWRIITSVFTVSFRTYTTCLWTKKPTQKMKKTNKTKLKNIEVLKKLHNLREKCTRKRKWMVETVQKEACWFIRHQMSASCHGHGSVPWIPKTSTHAEKLYYKTCLVQVEKQ